MTLRNKGFVTVVVNFESPAELASLRQPQPRVFGQAPLGASINIPGLVTIGPQFKIKGGLQGMMRVHANAEFQVTVASWDVAQSYPYKEDKPYDKDDLNIEDDGIGAAREGASNRTVGAEWSWDVGASGSLEVHFTLQITFGIVWYERLKIPNAAIGFGVDCYGRFYGKIGTGSSNNGKVNYCYGVDAGYKVSLFPGFPNLDRYWRITGQEVPILKSKDNCGESATSKRDLFGGLGGGMPQEWIGIGDGVDVDSAKMNT
ncbi:hypothetical protein B0H63DRAFT_529349 [Podospora didyma]|uniref:Uncharacterized protein n=1 Tax=Podospora didyma TaxID=330526 RepID=A0AAE0K073_9PEZI|nr:hypothetical protein B0H63DRAFT_529349 [Podospora didyma]